MKFSNIFIGLVSVTLVLLPQITLARTPAEAKYLASIEIVTKRPPLNNYLTRIHASTPTSQRLRYGYGVCSTLDKGATITDLNNNITFNGKTSENEKMYALVMQTFAIHDLCPEHKSLLNE